MEKNQLGTNVFGIKEMFDFFCDQKIKISSSFFVKKDNIYGKHKLIYAGTQEKLLNHLTNKKNFLSNWLSSLLIKESSEITGEDTFHMSSLPSEIQSIQKNIEYVKENDKQTKVYLSYDTYAKVIKQFNQNVQDYLIEGHPVKFKNLGTFCVVKVDVRGPQKNIDWKSTKEKKKQIEELGLDESAMVYYKDGYYFKLMFFKTVGLENLKYYSFRVAGGKTREGSKSMKYKLNKFVKRDNPEEYWYKIYTTPTKISNNVNKEIKEYQEMLDEIQDL